MRLKHLYIKDYKNLKDFSLDFENGNGLSILIGNNGSGKSNVLEAISGIFAEAFWNDSSFKMRLKVLQLNNKENEGIIDEKFVDREFSESLLPPYIFDDAKRASLRAELDAYYARLYGPTRTEIQYILDPHSVMGQDYPSETFRVLKEDKIAKYGEYMTQRLVLEAWDRME